MMGNYLNIGRGAGDRDGLFTRRLDCLVDFLTPEQLGRSCYRSGKAQKDKHGHVPPVLNPANPA